MFPVGRCISCLSVTQQWQKYSKLNNCTWWCQLHEIMQLLQWWQYPFSMEKQSTMPGNDIQSTFDSYLYPSCSYTQTEVWIRETSVHVHTII